MEDQSSRLVGDEIIRAPMNHKMITLIVCGELADRGNSRYKAIIHDDDLIGF